MKLKPSEPCTCEVCVGMCKRPGWPTPEEAARLMDAGLADRLMLDYWVGEPDIEVICPANPGYEGAHAWEPSGFVDALCLIGSGFGRDNPLLSGCTFFKNGLCEIHESGAKPIECRVGHHDAAIPKGSHEQVAQLWTTDEAKAVVARWKAEVE